MKRSDFPRQFWSLSGVLVGMVLLFALAASAQAPSIEGTYQLISRKLPDGTMLSSPDIMGLCTHTKSHRNFNIVLKDATGKFYSYSVVSTYKLAYTQVAGDHARRLRFVHQPNAKGYGHAVFCAREFTGQEPFLHLVGDHLYVSATEKSCAQHLVEVAQSEECSVSAVQRTRESHIGHYGVIGGHRVHGRQGLYRIETVAEKPTPTEAEERLLIPGLRAGQYLSFFGMHVLTPAVIELLAAEVADKDGACCGTLRSAGETRGDVSSISHWKRPGGDTTSA